MAVKVQKIGKVIALQIGQNFENLSVTIRFDMTEWMEEFPEANLFGLFKRPGDEYATPVSVSYDADSMELDWQVGTFETSVTGVGFLEIRAVDPDIGLLKKSKVIPCSIETTLDPGDVIPDPYEDWLDQLLSLASQAEDDAEQAQDAAERADTAADTAEAAVAHLAEKVSKPTENPDGDAGQLLRTNGDGTTEWVDQGLPTDEQTAGAVAAWLDDHPEATTTVEDGAITFSKLDDTLKNVKNVVQFNILDYPGNTLNEKFDRMKAEFKPWQTKQIIIPFPDVSDPACIKIGNDVKWKISAPLVFDNTCNCSYISIQGELSPICAVDSAILVYDAQTKPDNVSFVSDIYIRGDRANNNTIGNGIEIRSGARIRFAGNVYINDCDICVKVGGEDQTRPILATFDKIYGSFFDTCGVYISGNMQNQLQTWFRANDIEIQCAQNASLSGIVIKGGVYNTVIRNVLYNTDVAKSGYATYDLENVVDISIEQGSSPCLNLTIGTIYGTTADRALYINNYSTDLLRNVVVMYAGISNTSKTAVYARNCTDLIIFNTANTCAIDVAQCIRSRIINATGAIASGDRFCSINGIGLDSTTAIGSVPVTPNLRTGDVTLVKNQYGTRVYIFDGDANIPFDGQMFVPNISTLPSAAWNMRGKMYRVNNDNGDDIIAVCIRKNGAAYAWYDLVSQTWI